jgi:hypothetical protein
LKLKEETKQDIYPEQLITNEPVLQNGKKTMEGTNIREESENPEVIVPV